MQDEEKLLCRVATEHDLADGHQLVETDGWLTLLAVLESSSGEKPPKRRSPDSQSDGDNDERLAKRVRGVRLV